MVAPASAQNKPRSLVPSLNQDQTQPVPSADNQTQPETSTNTRDLFAPQSSSGLQVQSLSAVHPASVNLISVDQGGLGFDLWNRTRPEIISELLLKLAAPVKSPAMMTVYRKLLLTGGDLPAGARNADKIMELRIRKIMDQGWFEAAKDYFARIPANRRTPAINQLEAELNLLVGRDLEACADLRQPLDRDSNSTFWAKLDIFCKLANQDFDRADLEIALLEEKGEKDPLFFSLAAAIQGSQIDFSERSEPLSPVHFALLKKLDAAFPKMLVQNASAAVQNAMLATPNRIQDAKLDIILDVLESGNSVSLAADFLNPTEAAPAAETPLEDDTLVYSRLLQAITLAQAPEEKAQLLSQLWEEAKAQGDLFAVSKVTLPVLENLQVAAQSQEFMRKAASLLLMNGKPGLALQWERASRRAAIQGTAEDRLQARKDISRLDVYVLLSGKDGIARWNSQSFTTWLDAVKEDPNAAKKGAYLLMAMEVFGYSVSEADWDRLLYLEQSPAQSYSNHTYENILVNSALRKAKGKTVSLGLLSVGSESPDKISLTSTRAVLSALKAVGLQEDARKLALEIAILMDL
ncbi:hypothetical protein [Sneathiella limimaris]|uniref:hypothetical protein n=1 Tax=Sneathiella limimaris TaxID=1964213 RepID=UPI0019D2A43C|nr:hypothetical protein [Sneathiella limimaris]